MEDIIKMLIFGIKLVKIGNNNHRQAKICRKIEKN